MQQEAEKRERKKGWTRRYGEGDKRERRDDGELGEGDITEIYSSIVRRERMTRGKREPRKWVKMREERDKEE